MTMFEVTTPTRLGPESNGMHMTREEFDAVEAWDEHHRYELVNGIVVASPFRSIEERKPNDVLGYLLQIYMDSHPDGPLDETAPEQEIETSVGIRRSDRAIWTGLGRPPRIGEDLPTIVVEFVSQSSRDRRRGYVEKRGEYAAIGVAEYWVVDRFDRSLTVCHLDGRQDVVREGATYTTPLLPNLELPLDRLLSAADRYATPDS